MSEERILAIGQLANEAGVTPRTIRFYVAEGLLDAPERGGRAATYNEDHLLRLRLVRRLKEQYLPLSEIAAFLKRLDRRAILELLAQEEPSLPQSDNFSSAKKYLRDLLHRSPGASSITPVGKASPSHSVTRGVRDKRRETEPTLAGFAEASLSPWHRIQLTPDVEIHVRADARLGDKVARLIELARDVLEPGEEAVKPTASPKGR